MKAEIHLLNFRQYVVLINDCCFNFVLSADVVYNFCFFCVNLMLCALFL